MRSGWGEYGKARSKDLRHMSYGGMRKRFRVFDRPIGQVYGFGIVNINNTYNPTPRISASELLLTVHLRTWTTNAQRSESVDRPPKAGRTFSMLE